MYNSFSKKGCEKNCVVLCEIRWAKLDMPVANRVTGFNNIMKESCVGDPVSIITPDIFN
jgi:hypothetical protein